MPSQSQWLLIKNLQKFGGSNPDLQAMDPQGLIKCVSTLMEKESGNFPTVKGAEAKRF
jgi:hypothetical protein